MSEVVYHNGSLVPRAEATVSIFDGGFLHGAGLFETMRAENGRIFRLESHIKRLRQSAQHILRPIECHELPSGDDFSQLLEQNHLLAARVRLTVSAGAMVEADGDAVQPLTVCATATKLDGYPTALYEGGVQVVICNARQSRTDPTAGHKTTACFPRLLGLREAGRVGAIEAIWFTERNELAEGSISNVFVVHKNVVRTPPLDTPVLPGIARAITLQLASELDLETEEVKLNVNDLLDADEVFLTNAIMQVMPVVRVEKRDIGDGKVGSVARRLFDAYRDLVRKECRSE